jgi:outer membrane lipoprotein SlyB
VRNAADAFAGCNAVIVVSPALLHMTELSASTAPSTPRSPLRSPAAWIGLSVLALSGVAGASYLAGRSADRTEPPPTPAVVEASPSAAPTAAKGDTPVATAKAVCADCGVVESVQALTRKGEGTGVGAVAGGVVGGLIGHQMGAGQGKTAMTVLGAVGGGLAGNEVEKRARATTVYQVRVRTNAGKLRTFEQASAPPVGQRVRIDGHHLRAAPTEG